MKTSLRKLRGFTLHHRHGEQKDRRDLRPIAQFDELTRASQDMQDMRDCYDSLLSAAAATANSAYEFSESLREMGACLLEKTALNDDEESGRVLLMLGKAQYELQKLVDCYRSHISQTITIPSESLLNELRTVEEMKRQCDEKREVYQYMMTRQREKGRGKSGRGENFTLQHLQAAQEEYDEEATLCVFRLKSLKQGQSRSLLTQATRHHAAQLRFFRKALKTLEAIEPHVKLISEVQHIDYNFCELEDDDGDEGDDDDNDDDSNDDDSYGDQDDGELSFDYVQKDREQDVSTSRNSMDLDTVDVTFPQTAILEASKENLHENYRKSFSFRGEYRASSQSAPLFAENFSDPSIRVKQMRHSSSRKFNTYVLPTPIDTKSSNTMTSSSPPTRTLKTSMNGRRQNLWHSSPLGLEPKKYERLPGSEKSFGSITTNAQSILRESNNNTSSARLPRPLADGLVFSRVDHLAASDPKKIKRRAFSGPITKKPLLTKPVSAEHHQLLSGPLLQNPSYRLSSTSPKVSPPISPSASPTFNSSPKISELHELPRPPAGLPFKSSRSLALVGYSAPLAPKGHLLPGTRKLLPSNAASPLPTPSQIVTRSSSIPSSGHRATAMIESMPLDSTNNSNMAEDFSPPLTPIAFPNIQPPPTTSES